MSDFCSKCSTEILPSERACSNCGRDAGFPNVRSANSNEERTALENRFAEAKKMAVARGITIEFDAFRIEVGRSRAVMNRSLGALNSWAEGPNPLLHSFHCQVELMARAPTGSNYDQQRTAADGAINPFCFQKISPAALTLDEGGLLLYGPYSVILKDIAIEDRSSVFEENPFEFNQRHHVVAGQTVPLGYRAPWAERGRLAAVKLQHRIERGMEPIKFPIILMEDRRDQPNCDYVEVHIYGPVNRASIEKVVGPKPASRADQLIWRRTARALCKLGVVVEETP